MDTGRLECGRGSGIPGVAVKCVEIRRNIHGEGSYLTNTDTEARKRGEQTGLDTLVVHALNDANWMLGAIWHAVSKLTR